MHDEKKSESKNVKGAAKAPTFILLLHWTRKLGFSSSKDNLVFIFYANLLNFHHVFPNTHNAFIIRGPI